MIVENMRSPKNRCMTVFVYFVKHHTQLACGGRDVRKIYVQFTNDRVCRQSTFGHPFTLCSRCAHVKMCSFACASLSTG